MLPANINRYITGSVCRNEQFLVASIVISGVLLQ